MVVALSSDVLPATTEIKLIDRVSHAILHASPVTDLQTKIARYVQKEGTWISGPNPQMEEVVRGRVKVFSHSAWSSQT